MSNYKKELKNILNNRCVSLLDDVSGEQSWLIKSDEHQLQAFFGRNRYQNANSSQPGQQRNPSQPGQGGRGRRGS